MKPDKPEVSRRAFIGSVTAAGAAVVSASVGSTGLRAQTRTTPHAPDGALLKAGLMSAFQPDFSWSG